MFIPLSSYRIFITKSKEKRWVFVMHFLAFAKHGNGLFKHNLLADYCLCVSQDRRAESALCGLLPAR